MNASIHGRPIDELTAEQLGGIEEMIREQGTDNQIEGLNTRNQVCWLYWEDGDLHIGKQGKYAVHNVGRDVSVAVLAFIGYLVTP